MQEFLFRLVSEWKQPFRQMDNKTFNFLGDLSLEELQQLASIKKPLDIKDLKIQYKGIDDSLPCYDVSVNNIGVKLFWISTFKEAAVLEALDVSPKAKVNELLRKKEGKDFVVLIQSKAQSELNLRNREKKKRIGRGS